MIYSLKDIYYINLAMDEWICAEDETSADQDENTNNTNERGMSDD